MEDVFAGWKRLWPTLRAFVVSKPIQALVCSDHEKQAHKKSRNGGEEHQGLSLERDAVACDAWGDPDTLEEPAGSGSGGGEMLNLLHTSELEGLCDDLAAESHPLVLGGGLA
jgi:hypothetical protein